MLSRVLFVLALCLATCYAEETLLQGTLTPETGSTTKGAVSVVKPASGSNEVRLGSDFVAGSATTCSITTQATATGGAAIGFTSLAASAKAVVPTSIADATAAKMVYCSDTNSNVVAKATLTAPSTTTTSGAASTAAPVIAAAAMMAVLVR